MNTAPEICNYPVLRDDQIKNLQYFVKLERGRCFNSHEVYETQEEIEKKICECIHRGNNMVVSCTHSQEYILGTLGGRDILNRTIEVFGDQHYGQDIDDSLKLLYKNLEKKLMLYRAMINVFDVIRQGIEGNKTRLAEFAQEFEWWVGCSLFKDIDTLIDNMLLLAQEIIHAQNLQKGDTGYVHFLVRFRSLKNEFSSTWEPQILDESQKYAQELLDNQTIAPAGATIFENELFGGISRLDLERFERALKNPGIEPIPI